MGGKKPSTNVGLCLGELIAIDIDVDENEGAVKAQQQAFRILGPTNFIRVGRPPRRPLFYRLTSFEEAKLTSGWTEGAVQLLASTQQSVIYGIHPDTLKPYTWPESDLKFAKPSDIPATSLAALDDLRRALKGVPTDKRAAECPRIRIPFEAVVDPTCIK